MSASIPATSFVDAALEELKARQNTDGGFAIVKGGESRPDATAWAVLALRSCGVSVNLLETAGHYLESFQLKDGRVVIDRDHDSVLWTTYTAAWAWQDWATFQKVQEKALDFILKTSGRWSYFGQAGIGHNLSLKGWSWVEGTSSWIDSSALALLALRAARLQQHARYLEGIKLMENREIASGGWNFGNTVIYGTELRPNSESTGMAMSLLDIHDPRHALSVGQLKHYIRKETGPLSLAWTLLAIGKQADLAVLEESIARQKGEFCQTEWLGLLCMAAAVISQKPSSSFLGFSLEERS